jgi:hypothetical protein
MAQHYVASGYVASGYYQTGLSIDWLTKVIFVPKFFLTLVSGTTYQLDTNAFRIALRDIEDDEAGITFAPTHNHNTQVTLSGVTYARVIEIINGYTVTFEDGLYAVNLVGSNNNIPDVLNLNQVSVRASNSAGLQTVNTAGGSGITAGDKTDIISGVLTAAIATPIQANVVLVNSLPTDGLGGGGASLSTEQNDKLMSLGTPTEIVTTLMDTTLPASPTANTFGDLIKNKILTVFRFNTYK